MKKTCFLLCLVLSAILITSCAARPFFRPAGDRVGSCRGYLKPAGRSKIYFTLDLYKQSKGTMTAYFSLPGKGVRYGVVDNIDFENGIVRIELSSPQRMYEGELITKGLVIEGKLEPWGATFKIYSDK